LAGAGHAAAAGVTERRGIQLAENVYHGLKRLMLRIFSHQPKTAGPNQVLVLQDSATRLQVVLEADLPAEAYRRLIVLDPSTVKHGGLIYHRQRGEWCPELRGESPAGVGT
jgi:hypothetical protein